MIEYYIPDINMYMVFGVLFGMFLIIQLDSLVRDIMNFVKGWRTSN